MCTELLFFAGLRRVKGTGPMHQATASGAIEGPEPLLVQRVSESAVQAKMKESYFRLG